MKVKLLVKRDGCEAGDVADYGPDKARELIGLHEAEEFIPAPDPPPKKKPHAPEKATKSVNQEPAQAGLSVKEDKWQ